MYVKITPHTPSLSRCSSFFARCRSSNADQNHSIRSPRPVACCPSRYRALSCLCPAPPVRSLPQVPPHHRFVIQHRATQPSPAPSTPVFMSTQKTTNRLTWHKSCSRRHTARYSLAASGRTINLFSAICCLYNCP